MLEFCGKNNVVLITKFKYTQSGNLFNQYHYGINIGWGHRKVYSLVQNLVMAQLHVTRGAGW